MILAIIILTKNELSFHNKKLNIKVRDNKHFFFIFFESLFGECCINYVYSLAVHRMHAAEDTEIFVQVYCLGHGELPAPIGDNPRPNRI